MRLKMMRHLWFALSYFLLTLGLSAVNADVLILKQIPEQATSLSPYYQVHQDPSHQLTIEKILSTQGAVEFQPLINNHANFGYQPDTYWFKVNILNQSNNELQQLLEFKSPLLDNISVYIVNSDNNNILSRHTAGDTQPFEERQFSSSTFVFPISLAAMSNTALYIRLKTSGSLSAEATLQGQDLFLQQNRSSSFYLNLYLGVLIALIAYNFLIFVSLRKIYYFYLALVGCSVLLVTGSINAVWFELFWPESPIWHNVSVAFGFSLTGLLSSVFSRSFLNTFEEALSFDALFQVLIIIFAVLALASLALPLIYIAPLISILAIVLAIISISTATSLSLKGNRYAQVYLFAWLILMLGIATFSATNLGWLPNNLYTQYSFELGSALGMLLLSLSLAERIKFFQQENDKSRLEAFKSHSKMIHVLRNTEQELNHRVQERTDALEKAKKKLQDQGEKLKHLAHFDSLTGLANRFLVTEKLNLLLARCKREKSKLAVLFLDLDGFKQINDQYGHQTGDKLLRATADKLRFILRDSDVIGRIGGDEFIVIIDTSEGAINPEEVADKIKAAVLQPVTVNDITVEMGVSIGIAIYPDNTSDVDSLMNISDQEMYINKQSKAEPVITAN